MTKQAQRAGDHSHQLQAARDINIGVSAADVVQITRIEVSRVLDELTLSAKDKANSRITALAECVIEHFREKPELFNAFGDPDFQYSLQDAGRAAASNDDEHTERLLVDLLANRATEGNSSRVRLATSQAIRAADKLSQDALNGITATWAISSLSSSKDDFTGEMETATKVAETLIAIGLPEDKGWVNDIDVLNLARVHGMFPRVQYSELFKARVPEDTVTGIDANESRQLVDAATTAVPELGAYIMDHPLKPGFVRLAGKDRDDLLSRLPDNAAEVSELQQLIGQNGYGIHDNTATAALVEALAQSSAISVVAKWWDSIPNFGLTVAGDVIGYANARRYITFSGADTVTELLRLRSQ